jgi:riboflavin synthase
MFTGIVTAVGRVVAAESSSAGRALVIESPYDDLAPGESVAIDGACLTVESSDAGRFRTHVVRTTMERTLFETMAEGRRVNLERALRVGDRLGGHLVQGHVDGVGTVERVSAAADATLLDIRVPDAVASVTVPLGSITVDGVSLTVNAIPSRGVVQVSLVPFTLQHTTLGERVAGDRVHIESDTIGKYLRQLMAGSTTGGA